MFLLAAASCAMGAETPPDAALERAKKILSSTPLIDGHNDLPWTLRSNSKIKGDVEGTNLQATTSLDTDLPKMRRGQVGGQFWSVWIPPEMPDKNPVTVQLEQIDIARRFIAKYPEDLEFCLTAQDVERVFKKGKIASMLGMEGGQGMNNSLGSLRAFYGLGVRYMTLTHWKTIDWADSATDAAKHNGLTPFGKDVVREMNRLGMLVDLSHVSEKTMSDALDVSEAPVIFSHSSARAITDHPRNVPDSILFRMSKNRGVVMVTFIPDFVSNEANRWGKGFNEAMKDKLSKFESAEWYDKLRREYAAKHPAPKATLAQVADHIDHVRKIAGADHVGIGSDFWGSENTTVGLEDVSKFPDLIAELLRRGWSDSDIKGLVGLNVLRVMREAEAVAERLKRTRTASLASFDRAKE